MNRTTPAKARFENVSDPGATLPDMNTTTKTDLPIPTGATSAGDWEDGRREFFMRDWSVEIEQAGADFRVDASGVQFADGRVESEVWITFNDRDLIGYPLTPHQAREIALRLFKAADEHGANGQAVK